MRIFSYLGPEEIRLRVQDTRAGEPIEKPADLAAWQSKPEAREEDGWATYVIDPEGRFLIAPRRTEHVACAAGRPVRGAGELRVDETGAIDEISNNSTGYCPPEDTWPEVEAALERAEVEHPGAFTFVARFRLCTKCGQRNLVKDDWFECSVCGAELPGTWNFNNEEDV